MYEQYKSNYRYAVQTLRTYLNKHGMDTLFNIDMQNQLRQIKKAKKYNVVLSLLKPEDAITLFEDRNVLVIRGILFVQRILHDEHFELF